MALDKSARSAQLARCVSHTGDSFLFGTIEFRANFRQLRPTDPRLKSSKDRLIELVVATAAMPGSPALKTGDSIYDQSAARYRRLVIDPQATGDGLTLLLVTA